MEETTEAKIITELSTLNGKKYVKFNYFIEEHFHDFLIVENAEQIAEYLDKSRFCGGTDWHLYIGRESIDDNYDEFFIDDCANFIIYDKELADEFETHVNSIPFKLDGDIYNKNIIT